MNLSALVGYLALVRGSADDMRLFGKYAEYLITESGNVEVGSYLYHQQKDIGVPAYVARNAMMESNGYTPKQVSEMRLIDIKEWLWFKYGQDMIVKLSKGKKL